MNEAFSCVQSNTSTAKLKLKQQTRQKKQKTGLQEKAVTHSVGAIGLIILTCCASPLRTWSEVGLLG